MLALHYHLHGVTAQERGPNPTASSRKCRSCWCLVSKRSDCYGLQESRDFTGGIRGGVRDGNQFSNLRKSGLWASRSSRSPNFVHSGQRLILVVYFAQNFPALLRRRCMAIKAQLLEDLMLQ